MTIEDTETELDVPPLPPGFIAHDGSPCPVPPETMVVVQFRDGGLDDPEGREARYWDGPPDKWWEWEGDFPVVNIMAYRVLA